jgi:hypothetical protein
MIKRELEAYDSALEVVEDCRKQKAKLRLQERSRCRIQSLFNWDGACVINSVNLAILNLGIAPQFLSRRGPLERAFLALQHDKSPIADPTALREVLGEPFKYVVGDNTCGFTTEAYLETLIQRLPLLREMSAAVIERGGERKRAVESVHYLIPPVNTTISRLLEINQYAFITLPQVLIFSIQIDWFSATPSLVGSHKFITVTDISGRARRYSLTSTVQYNGNLAHLTANIRRGSHWYNIDNSDVKEIKSSKAVSSGTCVLFFEEDLVRHRGRVRKRKRSD